ncbi:hypothetical protein SAMN05444161_8317 [Rhizobiales bacterium GAS191]|nr:hypothetical protein SAMN05444161_8317 [Rhizobiales bacterium GAS191]
MRLALGCPFVAAIIMSWPGHTLAQSPPSLSAGIPEAPIGHRQPTARDVPSNDSIKGVENTGKSDIFGPAARFLPKLDIKATCRRAQPLSEGQESAYQGCLNDETEAQKELSRTWFNYRAVARAVCTQETRIGGAPSFVELLTCLQLDRQAADAENENKKQLNLPGAARRPSAAPSN